MVTKLFGEETPELAEVRGLTFEALPEFVAYIEATIESQPDSERLIAEQRREYLRKRMKDAAEMITGAARRSALVALAPTVTAEQTGSEWVDQRFSFHQLADLAENIPGRQRN